MGCQSGINEFDDVVLSISFIRSETLRTKKKKEISDIMGEQRILNENDRSVDRDERRIGIPINHANDIIIHPDMFPVIQRPNVFELLFIPNDLETTELSLVAVNATGR